jgi:hypothetical protein
MGILVKTTDKQFLIPFNRAHTVAQLKEVIKKRVVELKDKEFNLYYNDGMLFDDDSLSELGIEDNCFIHTCPQLEGIVSV